MLIDKIGKTDDFNEIDKIGKREKIDKNLQDRQDLR